MSDRIQFHRIGPENAALLAAADAFDQPVDPVQLAAFVADPGHEMIVATEGAKVVGMASGTVVLHPDQKPAFFVNEVGVEEAVRSRGIGTALVERLLDTARARGCASIWLATEATNRAARALYRKLGARETEGVVVYDWGVDMGDGGANAT
ncbi:MAG: GNAT family N-acetyltransferase [Pseudomonadota bacterium]